MLRYVAAEFPPSHGGRVRVCQSLLFEDVLPTATRRFEAEGIGEVIWTEPPTASPRSQGSGTKAFEA